MGYRKDNMIRPAYVPKKQVAHLVLPPKKEQKELDK